jgi:GT2 family glycosyltransferase
LEASVTALLQSADVDVKVVVVDNGCTDGAIERLNGRPGVCIVSPGHNLGFAGGCNLGSSQDDNEFVAFVNADAIVAPDALARLAEAASAPDVGITSASIRLSDDPERLNSGGNDIHFLGLSWSGAFGELATTLPDEREITGASGAAMLLRREVWEALGGFCDEYFAYHEDAELSLRCWQRDWRVIYVPGAVVRHRYEFSRNRRKLYLVERNRLILVLTVFQARTLLMLSPALVLLELAMTAASLRQGWVRDKVAGWAWIARNRRWVRERRRQLQSERVVTDKALAPRFANRWRAGTLPLPSYLRPADRTLALYWSAVRRLL